MPFQYRPFLFAFNVAKLQYCREPIHGGDNLVADFILRELCGITDDRWNTNTAFQKASLLPDPLAGKSAATGAVEMIFWQTAGVIVDADRDFFERHVDALR